VDPRRPPSKVLEISEIVGGARDGPDRLEFRVLIFIINDYIHVHYVPFSQESGGKERKRKEKSYLTTFS
jgi:hypothetical protein